MELHVQEWMLKMEEWVMGLSGEWRGTKKTVIDEAAVMSARLDRIESKLDEALNAIREIKGA